MPRAKKVEDIPLVTNELTMTTSGHTTTVQLDDKTWAMSVNFAMGVDQIGNRLSFQAKKPGVIEVFENYIEIKSQKNGRKVRVYSSNIKAIELF